MDSKRTSISRFFAVIPALLAMILLASVSLFLGINRFIGRDEGYYLYAARDVLSGRLPYIDFFYPQMPLLPYVYAIPFGLFGESWLVGRLTAALLTVAGGFFVYLLARNEQGERTGIAALLFYTLSSSIMVWNTTAETYSLAMTLCLAAVYSARGLRKPWLSGILFGLCVLTRLTFAPIGAVILLEIICKNKKDWLAGTRQFLLGCTLGVSPALYFFALDQETFLFNNFYYHNSKSLLPDEYFNKQRIKIIQDLLGLREAAAMNGFQYPFLLYLSTFHASWLALVHRKVDFNFILGALLIAIHFLPSPPYIQYFVVALPFLILSATSGLTKIIDYIQRRFSTRVAIPLTSAVLFAVIIPYSHSGSQKVLQYAFTGDNVIGVGEKNAESWTIAAVSEASRKLNSHILPDEEIFASWPGYLIETQGRALSRTENHFGVQYAKRVAMTREERRKLRIKRPQRIIENFAEGRYRIAVLYTGKGRSTPMRESLLARGGKEIKVGPGIIMIQRPSSEQAAPSLRCRQG